MVSLQFQVAQSIPYPAVFRNSAPRAEFRDFRVAAESSKSRGISAELGNLGIVVILRTFSAFKSSFLKQIHGEIKLLTTIKSTIFIQTCLQSCIFRD